ncbi:MAG TPA: terminase family protein, partial [Candidatus Sulfopaludibacter sp.]|nr:terminase family protein [Candidatus Sulfopaludibacter sp.]
LLPPPPPDPTDALPPADWVQQRLGIVPDARQSLLLQSSGKRTILNCCRQWGKSTITAAKTVEIAWRNPKSLILVIAPVERQSHEFVLKAEDFLSRLDVQPKGDGQNPISVLLPNDSRIVGLPAIESTIRGFSAVSLLVVDEASRVPDSVYRAIRPMLAVSDGSLWLISTPLGKRGFFYETWANGGPAWHRVKATGPECPRIRPEFLAEERLHMGEREFGQEYLCEFADVRAGVFDPDLIAQAFSDDIKPLFFP